MLPKHLGAATLYQIPDGSLTIVNTAQQLAWSLKGYLYPGQAFNDLIKAAQGKNPRHATGLAPAPELAAFPPEESQAIATLTGDRYIVFWDRPNDNARIYLGYSLPPELNPNYRPARS